jgi:hypothetical protein
MTTPRPRHRRRNRPQPKAPARPIGETALRIIAIGLSAFSLIGVALTSLGFSVALALNTMFGPDILEILRGPLDYLVASAWVVVTGYIELLDRVTGPRGLLRSLDAALVVASLVAVAGVAWVYVRTHHARLRRFVSWTGTGVRSGKQWVEQRPSRWRLPAILVSSAASGALMYAVSRIVLAVFTVVLLPFVIGYRAAQLHFYATVIEPYACAESMSAQTHRARLAAELRKKEENTGSEDRAAGSDRPYRAVCVEVQSKELGIFKGRRIIATNESIALYDPATGAVKIVPRKDAVVSFIDKL